MGIRCTVAQICSRHRTAYQDLPRFAWASWDPWESWALELELVLEGAVAETETPETAESESIEIE